VSWEEEVLPLSDEAGTSLLLGADSQIGLGIVRELGRRGVRVVVITTSQRALGAVSRYAAEVVQVASLRSDEALCVIRSLGDRLGSCSLLAVAEAQLAWIDGQRSALGPNVHPALPTAEALAIVTDKSRTLDLARLHGIDVPLGGQPASTRELEDLAGRLRYPVVLKWSNAAEAATRLDEAGLPFLKAEYVYDAKALLQVGERYRPLGIFPLVQEYCAGYGLGQFFFLRRGHAVQRFQHRRVAEWPPEGGFSSVCETVPLSEHSELQEKSLRLLQSIGWEGVAMVEYRMDECSGRAALMEINGRFWGSFPLTCHAGAGFAWLAHRAALELPFGEIPRPAGVLRCRMVATELKRLVRIVFQRNRICDPYFKARPVHEVARFVADFFRPRVRYYVWDWDDPRPFFVDAFGALAKKLRR
jgi:predicted ATP-grasp superfamily ATP-dependent carboligase